MSKLFSRVYYTDCGIFVCGDTLSLSLDVIYYSKVCYSIVLSPQLITDNDDDKTNQ